MVKHADKLILGEPGGGRSERIESFARCSSTAGIRCEASDNVRRAIWYKLWGNATINPMSALTRSTADKLLDDPAFRALMAEAMDELAEIGAAIGCPIERKRRGPDGRSPPGWGVQILDASGRRGRAADRARSLAGRAARDRPARRHSDARSSTGSTRMTRLLGENLGLL